MVICTDCRVQIFDSQTGDKLKVLSSLPELPYGRLTNKQCVDATVIGGELLVLGFFGHANPALLTLNDKLEYCVKATATLHKQTFGLFQAAEITDADTVYVATNDRDV